MFGIEERLADLRAAAKELSRPVPVLRFDDLTLALPAPAIPAGNWRPDGTTEAGLLYTSGTTGRPKGCVLTNTVARPARQNRREKSADYCWGGICLSHPPCAAVHER